MQSTCKVNSLSSRGFKPLWAKLSEFFLSKSTTSLMHIFCLIKQQCHGPLKTTRSFSKGFFHVRNSERRKTNVLFTPTYLPTYLISFSFFFVFDISFFLFFFCFILSCSFFFLFLLSFAASRLLVLFSKSGSWCSCCCWSLDDNYYILSKEIERKIHNNS